MVREKGEKNNKKQHQQEEESMMAWSMKDHSVGPGGLLPIPTLWRTLRIGWERGCDGEKHPHEDQPFNERPGGRLAPLKGVCWESRAPINKKHGSGIVFPTTPDIHTPRLCLNVWLWLLPTGDAVVSHNLYDPKRNLLWLWMDRSRSRFHSHLSAVGYNCHLSFCACVCVCAFATGYLWNPECWGHVTCT